MIRVQNSSPKQPLGHQRRFKLPAHLRVRQGHHLRDALGLARAEGEGDDSAIVNSAVFHGGFLTGGEFFDYRKVTRESDPALYDWRDRFEALCARFAVSPAAAAAAYGRSAPGVVALALSTSQPERVAEMVTLAHAEMSGEFEAALVAEGLIG